MVLFHFQNTVCGEVAAVATSPKQELYGKKNNLTTSSRLKVCVTLTWHA